MGCHPVAKPSRKRHLARSRFAALSSRFPLGEALGDSVVASTVFLVELVDGIGCMYGAAPDFHKHARGEVVQSFHLLQILSHGE